MVMGLLSPRGSQILQHQMQVQPSLMQELVQVLHWELDEESGRMLVTFRRSVVVSTRGDSDLWLYVLVSFFWIFARSRVVMF